MKHIFDTDHAILFGIESAVLIYNIEFWIQKNKANQRHFYEGKYWTYNSVKAWHELFPYMTKDVIRKRLDFLVEKGILIRGNFSPDRRDRTNWYSLRCSELHLVSEPNAIVSEANSSLYTDSKPTDSKQSNVSESSDSVSQKALFDSTPDQNPSPKKKQKKESVRPDEFYPLFVKAWCDRYPELGFNAVSGVKIKSLVNHTKNYLSNGDKPQTPERALAMFEYVLEYIKRVNHFCHGKPITTLDSQYLSIIFELKNGKSTQPSKKQSAREWANSL